MFYFENMSQHDDGTMVRKNLQTTNVTHFHMTLLYSRFRQEFFSEMMYVMYYFGAK